MGLIKGDKRFKCSQDKETKELVCKSFRENRDGTQIELAGFRATVDGNCSPVITDSYENSDGELDYLEKKVLPKLSAKCNRTQSNYPDN